MNYLAHAFLAGTNHELLAGNFIADGIRGNNFHHLPTGIKQGIVMHRAIDTFTDAHPINTEMRKLFYPTAGKYAGVVLDIFYDHLLAVNWAKYAEKPLDEFVQWSYTVVEQHEHLLPEKTAFMFPYMRDYNWLLNYSHESGIMRSLAGLSNRIASRPRLEEAGAVAFENKTQLDEAFCLFFPELIDHCNLHISQINTFEP